MEFSALMEGCQSSKQPKVMYAQNHSFRLLLTSRIVLNYMLIYYVRQLIHALNEKKKQCLLMEFFQE